jgi:hypothetical protein
MCESKGVANISAVLPRPWRMMKVVLWVPDIGGMTKDGGYSLGFGFGMLALLRWSASFVLCILAVTMAGVTVL